MSSVVRASKYRHVYVEPDKKQVYQNLRLESSMGDQAHIKGNTKFFAVALSGGGGALAPISYDNVGKFATGVPSFVGHKSKVLDFDFNPFHEHILASGSEDSTIKVWGIPEDGLKENVSDPLVDLNGHGRRVTFVRFHPTANHVLASTSGDYSVKLWDVEKGGEIATMSGTSDSQLSQDLVWDMDGELLATTCKDKCVRIFDPRAATVAMKKEDIHEGSKSVKMTFLGAEDDHRLVTVGFTKQSKRQCRVWDSRKMDSYLKNIEIDQAPGIILPFYDAESRLLYLCGKGDGNIRYYEMVDSDPYCYPISEYRSVKAAKGVAMLPKRTVDVMKCETARMLKLTSDAVEMLHVYVPRKSEAFQDDLFPDCAAGVAAMNADEWYGGMRKSPVKMSMRPGENPEDVEQRSPEFTPPKSSFQLQKELDDANARIKELEEKLKAAGLEV